VRVISKLAIAATATASLFATTVGQASAAEGQILGAGQATAIDGSYIVVLKEGHSADLAAKHGAKVKRRYQSFPGFSAEMTDGQARRLAADPAVAYVEQNHVVELHADQLNPPSWGLDRVDQRALPLNSKYTYATGASNVTAYVIDSGIAIAHTDFGGRATHGKDLYDNDNDATDCGGHGTHVSGTIGGTKYGLAKQVKLVGVRVFGCSGSTMAETIIAGVDWVTANAVKPAVANMSLGGAKSVAINDAVQRLINSGVTAVVSGGNSNADSCNNSPASLPAAITVGASNINDAKWASSNWGTCLDLFAPGQDITSAKWDTPDGSFSTSGTSMAAPHVTGAAALYLSANPTATPQQVRDALVNASTPNVLTSIGTGSPNKLLYVAPATTPPPTCSTQTNATDVAIPDAGAAVTSSVTISGCTGTASATSKVAVDVKHTYRGDLVIDLVAPDGSSYRLKNSSSSDSADNVITTYTTNLSTETRNGIWKLKVQDVYAADTGKIDSWSLTL